MKKIINTILALTVVVGAFAQAPTKFNYQTAVRNGAGQMLENQNVKFRISILEESISGASVYSETHDVTSNQFGLVNFQIGAGSVVSGDISAIAWSSKPHFLNIEIDENGGTSFTNMGTSELVSVPYALSAPGTWDMLNGNYFTYNKVSIGTDGILTGPGETNNLLVYSPGTNGTGEFSSAMRAEIGGDDGSNNAIVGLAMSNSAGDNTGLFCNASNANMNYGVRAYGVGGTVGKGVQGVAFGSTDWSEGLSGYALESTASNNYGVTGNSTAISGGVSVGVGGFNNGTGNQTYGVLAYNGFDAGNDYNTGLYSYAEGAAENYAVDGTSNDAVGASYGLTGWAFGSGTHNIGVFGMVGATADTNYAGFFEGDVHITGTLTQPSDRRLKENIQPMDATFERNGGALSLVNRLNPVAYNYKAEMVNKINLPSVPQFGFIAQEVEQLFPDLIKQESTPEFKITTIDDGAGHKIVKKEKVGTQTYKAVNYVGLIPVLTQAIKEQQVELEALRSENEALKQLVNTKIKAMEEAVKKLEKR